MPCQHTATLFHGTPVGWLRLDADAQGLRRVAFADAPGPEVSGDPRAAAWLLQAARELDAYFAGQLHVFTVPLSLEDLGTPFQRRVWQALRAIPYGETCSYAALAAAVGCPHGARAVGQANHHNPLVIVVPCHRVVNADGGLGGYAGGLAIKQRLLALEAAHRQAAANPAK